MPRRRSAAPAPSAVPPATPAPRLGAREGGYLPLRDYAAIGDGRTVALVGGDGRVDWLPVPALHSPPVFAAIIDEAHGGRIELRPEADFTVERAYVDGTNVLRTVFTTASGRVAVTDALVTGVAGRLPWSQLTRRVEGLEGRVPMRWAVVPANLFGGEGVIRVDTVHGPILRAGTIDLVVVGVDHGRTDPHAPSDGFPDGPLEFRGAFTTSEGSVHAVAVCATDDEPIHLPDTDKLVGGVERSIENWRRWSEVFAYEGPYRDAVERSALALKLLIFSPTGAIAAAATTALPESLDGGKNWDYRFAWVRDLAYTVSALVEFGLREETHAAVSWVLKTLKQYGNEQHIFFRLDGTLGDGVHDVPAEGWRGIGPVQQGNPAKDQLQLGVYADMVGVMRQYVDAGNILDENTSELIVDFVDGVCRRWDEKDHGMWELPKARHYVSSKVGCWQALDDALHLLELGELKPSEDQVRLWRSSKRQLERWIARRGWSRKLGAYEMWPGSGKLDTSLLLHVGQGFGPAERMEATIDRMRERLAVGPLVYRYTDVDREEGTFTAVGFWMVEALARIGRLDEAERMMEELVAQANDVGLYSEMISAETGEFLGNLPQGLSHLALISAATTIARARERAA
jgi:GH15 family glucan-1,4-alpha-glucosidase